MGNSSSTSTICTSLETGNSASTSDSEAKSLGMTKVNDSVWMLHNSSCKTPSIEIIFFHGLHIGDYERAFWKTWLARHNESIIWPKHWLGEAFPNARILSISYNMSPIENSGQLDMHCLGENFVSDIIMDPMNIGQFCPVILVGHCLGGIVLKQFILSAHQKKAQEYQSPKRSSKIEIFLSNLKGVLFYGTPHIPQGSDIAKFVESSSCSSKYINKLLETCDATMVRIKDEFSKLRGNLNIKTFAMEEGLPTTVLGFHGFVVTEHSARHDIDDYYTVTNADHFNVCRPRNRESCGIFRKLHDFILKATPNNEVSIEKMCQNEEGNLGMSKLSREHQSGEAVHIFVLEDGVFENKQPVPKKGVGLHLLVNKVQNILQEEATLGIVGMGGIGKSTLAKALFNKLNPQYEYSCFVPDVKLISGTWEDVMKEVSKRIHCHGKPVANGWSVLRGRSLLLVLDDVSQDRDLQVFSYLMDVIEIAQDSRFIVTSRDKDFLNRSTDTDVFVYDLTCLSKEDSKKLFESYAFSRKADQLPWLERYVEKVVDKCGGLPLTLEVLGNYLKSNTHDMRIWEQTVEALVRAESVGGMDERLWAKLRLSYDALGKKEQEMFLDAATCFSKRPWTLHEAKAAWCVMHGSQDIRWKTLVDRSLVYDVAEDKFIRLHEQLLSLGRKIASELNKNRQWRAWESRAASNLLRSTKEPNEKEFFSLKLEFDWGSSNIVMPKSSLGMLKNLHYLEMETYGLSSKYPLLIDGVERNEELPVDSLVVLRSRNGNGLQFGQLPLDLTRSRNLAVLVLVKDGSLDEKHLGRSLGGLEALRIFTLSVSKLDILPDEIGHLSQLERFELTRCWSLRTVPSMFGRLSHLKHLSFEQCMKLDSLPESFGRLSNLEHLSFDGCWRLHALPESFGELRKLKVLDFKFCDKLHTLPESFGQLPTLTHLSFKYCPQLQTPSVESFCRFPNLQVLEIYNCRRIDSLFFFTGESPAALRHLSIGVIALTSIPECVKSFPSLQILEIFTLPLLNEFPPWLGGTSLGRPTMSRWTFNVNAEKFALQKKENLGTWQHKEVKQVSEWVHGKAMLKLEALVLKDRASDNASAPDYAGALAHLEALLDPESMLRDHLSGFILLEMGILKRETGNLHAALQDVTIALEKFNFVSQSQKLSWDGKGFAEYDNISKLEVQEMRYRCFLHRGNIRWLAGNETGARDDAKEALEFQYHDEPIPYRILPFPSLGENIPLFDILTEARDEQAKAKRMKMSI